jgi:AAA family ATP:ADP antiporter
LLVVIGLGILCFIKSSKYVFFDTSKERAYIPLDENSKINGKAAIDAVGSRLAKGSGAVLINVLVSLFGGLDNIIYISFFLVFLLLAVWFYAVYNLGPLYEQMLKSSDNEPK